MLYVPGAVDDAGETVIVALPLPVMVAGFMLISIPGGIPETVKRMDESNPPVAALVIVVLAEPPRDAQKDPGDAERLNPTSDCARALTRLLPFGLPHPVVRS